MSKQRPRRRSPEAIALRTWLFEHDRTQRWLADKLGVAESTVSNLFSGRKRPDDRQRRIVLRLTGIDLDPSGPPVDGSERVGAA